jgi:hypothetical protein
VATSLFFFLVVGSSVCFLSSPSLGPPRGKVGFAVMRRFQ